VADVLLPWMAPWLDQFVPAGEESTLVQLPTPPPPVAGIDSDTSFFHLLLLMAPQLGVVQTLETAGLYNTPVPPAPLPAVGTHEEFLDVLLLKFPWLGRSFMTEAAQLRNPVPPAPKAAVAGLPLLSPVPDQVMTQEDLRRRLARFTQLLSIAWNSLVKKGILVQTSPSDWTIVATTTQIGGLTGTFP
jgi:hypothetical protein